MTAVLTLSDSNPDLPQSASRNPVAYNTASIIQEATRGVQSLLASQDHPRPVDKVKLRHAEILEQVAEKMSATQASLGIAEDFNAEDAAHVAQLRSKLNTAVDTSRFTEKSLRPLPESAEKQNLMAALRELEIRINLIGTVLPRDTTPLQYDACKCSCCISEDVVVTCHSLYPRGSCEAVGYDRPGHDPPGHHLPRRHWAWHRPCQFYPRLNHADHSTCYVHEARKEERRERGL